MLAVRALFFIQIYTPVHVFSPVTKLDPVVTYRYNLFFFIYLLHHHNLFLSHAPSLTYSLIILQIIPLSL